MDSSNANEKRSCPMLKTALVYGLRHVFVLYFISADPQVPRFSHKPLWNFCSRLAWLSLRGKKCTYCDAQKRCGCCRAMDVLPMMVSLFCCVVCCQWWRTCPCYVGKGTVFFKSKALRALAIRRRSRTAKQWKLSCLFGGEWDLKFYLQN